MGMTIWTPLLDTGLVSTAALRICAVEFCFPKGRDAVAALSLYYYFQQLYDSGTAHTAHSVSLCSSSDTAQNVCLHLSGSIRRSFHCGVHLCVEHDLMERSP